MVNKHLTNQEFTDAYSNKFELALQIIDVAQRQMAAGEDVTLGRLLNDARKSAIAKLEEENHE